MPKIKISLTGKARDNQTYEIDSEDTVNGMIEVSNAHRAMRVTFINNAEKNRFYKGIEMCRAFSNGEAVYLTSFQNFK